MCSLIVCLNYDISKNRLIIQEYPLSTPPLPGEMYSKALHVDSVQARLSKLSICSGI